MVGDRCDGTLYVLGAGSVAVLRVFTVPVFVVGYEIGGCPLPTWAAIHRVRGEGDGVAEECLPVVFGGLAELVQGRS